MQLVLNGLIIGVLYGAVAVCFVLILKTSRVVHAEDPEHALIGSAVVWWLLTSLAPPIWAGMVAALGLMALQGVVTHRLKVRHAFAAPLISTTMTALGLAIFFHALLDWSLGSTARLRGANDLPPSLLATESLELFGHVLTIESLANIGMTVIAIVGLGYFFKITKTGITLRQAGVGQTSPCRSHLALAWTIATILSILASGLRALVGDTSNAMASIGENALPALVVGGLESFAGGAVGGLIIGLAEGIAHFIDASYWQAGGLINIAPFYAMLILMLIKPNGLFKSDT
jgi:branched-chain amino acid transport system permease protein